MLNLNTGSKSWWFTNSIGCTEQIETKLSKLKYDQQMELIKNYLIPTTLSVGSSSALLTENSSVTNMTNSNIIESLIQSNCLFPFYTIEIAQSGLLIILAVFGVIFGLLLANAFNEDDDTCNLMIQNC